VSKAIDSLKVKKALDENQILSWSFEYDRGSERNYAIVLRGRRPEALHKSLKIWSTGYIENARILNDDLVKAARIDKASLIMAYKEFMAQGRNR